MVISELKPHCLCVYMEKYPTVSQQHQQHQNNSSFELIEDSTDYSTVIPAEALLGISPTSNETAGRFSCSSVDPFSKKSEPTKLCNELQWAIFSH